MAQLPDDGRTNQTSREGQENESLQGTAKLKLSWAENFMENKELNFLHQGADIKGAQGDAF